MKFHNYSPQIWKICTKAATVVQSLSHKSFQNKANLNSRKEPTLSISWLLYLFKNSLASGMHFRKVLSMIRKLYSETAFHVSKASSIPRFRCSSRLQKNNRGAFNWLETSVTTRLQKRKLQPKWSWVCVATQLAFRKMPQRWAIRTPSIHSTKPFLQELSTLWAG